MQRRLTHEKEGGGGVMKFYCYIDRCGDLSIRNYYVDENEGMDIAIYIGEVTGENLIEARKKALQSLKKRFENLKETNS